MEHSEPLPFFFPFSYQVCKFLDTSWRLGSHHTCVVKLRNLFNVTNLGQANSGFLVYCSKFKTIFPKLKGYTQLVKLFQSVWRFWC